jgi:CheY-like chemotaxis protein
MAKIRIMLADDHTLFRQGIRTLISAEADMEIVGEASNGGDAVDKANEVRPNVVLVDIGMPGLSAVESTRQIKKSRPETKVLFLTMYDDEDYLVEGMELGASGYVLKDSPTACEAHAPGPCAGWAVCGNFRGVCSGPDRHDGGHGIPHAARLAGPGRCGNPRGRSVPFLADAGLANPPRKPAEDPR